MRVLTDGVRYQLESGVILDLTTDIQTVELFDALLDHLIYTSSREFSSDLATALHYLSRAGIRYQCHCAAMPPAAAAHNPRGPGEGVPFPGIGGTPSAPITEDPA